MNDILTKTIILVVAVAGFGIVGCSHLPVATVPVYGNLVKDADGNTYQTVIIGDQTWMAENLKTTRFNDGSTIFGNGWNNPDNATTPAYCWLDNNPTNKDVYGALYNWYAVNSGKLAPTGWHVSTAEDWKKLTKSVGGGAGGGKLKEAGTAHWRYSADMVINKNEYGFSARPGAYRFGSGRFFPAGLMGCYWDSDSVDATSAWMREMRDGTPSVNYGIVEKNFGLSVRCVKD